MASFGKPVNWCCFCDGTCISLSRKQPSFLTGERGWVRPRMLAGLTDGERARILGTQLRQHAIHMSNQGKNRNLMIKHELSRLVILPLTRVKTSSKTVHSKYASDSLKKMHSEKTEMSSILHLAHCEPVVQRVVTQSITQEAYKSLPTVHCGPLHAGAQLHLIHHTCEEPFLTVRV